MRKTWILVVAAFMGIAMIAAATALVRLDQASTVVSASDGATEAAAEMTKAWLAEGNAAANLPVVLKPENTPTSTATPTQTPTRPPQPTATVAPPPTPGSGSNRLANGGFEGGWTDLPPVSGYLINQQPNGWTLTWLEPGQPLWDAPGDVATGIAEMIHKRAIDLPPDEGPGGPNALILDGTHTYKMFHFGARFGSQLYQRVSLPAGSWQLIVPVQIHMHENLPPDGSWDQYSVESGVWVLSGGMQAGGWAHAKQMGDRRWFYHVIEFNMPAPGDVEVVIRVKSKYLGPKDFFVDATSLLSIGAVSRGAHREELNGRVVWRPRPVAEIPADEIVRP